MLTLMPVLGWLAFALAAMLAALYTALLFVGRASFHRTPYVVGIIGATLIGLVPVVYGGVLSWQAIATFAIAAGWLGTVLPTLLVPRREVPLQGGDALPAFSARATDGALIDRAAIIGAAPSLLILFRGHWCPFCVAQLGELARHYDALRAAGVRVFALSTEAPAQMASLEKRLGGRVTFLSDGAPSLIDALDARMPVPFYDRAFFGMRESSMALPLTLLVDRSGDVRFLYASQAVDDRPSTERVLTAVNQQL